MQRLFTTFASSWPGIGLLGQRCAIGALLLHNGYMPFKQTLANGLVAPELASAVLGIFVLAGLWTPVAGALVAVIELWIVLAGGSDAGMSLAVAVFGGTLAMIGPGAWSVDARLFGRKHIGS